MEIARRMSLNGMKQSYVYIMANYKKNVFYIGVTADVLWRVLEHKDKTGSKFTSKYKVDILVYLEEFEDIELAIEREKQLKNWHRDWKINLIRSQNPHMLDLSEGWYEPEDLRKDPETSSG